MMPALVWLQMIPLLGQVWQFFVVTRIANSIRNEFRSRGENSIIGVDLYTVEHLDKRPTRGIGIAYCTLSVVLILFNLFSDPAEIARDRFAALIPLLLAVSCVICWVIYWVQLAGMKRKFFTRSL